MTDIDLDNYEPIDPNAPDPDPSVAMLAQVADEREQDLYSSGGDRLERVARAGKRAQKLDEEIKTLEQAIVDRKAEKQELHTKIIPDLLRSIGLSSFALDDGTTVELKDQVFPDIPAGKRDVAYEWLRANGHGDLIKHEIKITFGMGEDVEALAVRRQLTEHNSPLNFTEKETVLPQSLKAWVREQEKRGVHLPEEFFSVHRVTTAEFKPSKQAKK